MFSKCGSIGGQGGRIDHLRAKRLDTAGDAGLKSKNVIDGEAGENGGDVDDVSDQSKEGKVEITLPNMMKEEASSVSNESYSSNDGDKKSAIIKADYVAPLRQSSLTQSNNPAPFGSGLVDRST